MGEVTRLWQEMCSKQREWTSSQEMISTSVPSARCQWVMSDCQVSLGRAASNRIQDERGRLRGSGVPYPPDCCET